MIDQETQERLQVNTDGDAGPYLMVPLEQVPAIRAVLQQHGIAHSLDQDAVQFDDKPIIALINFGRGTDPVRIQQLLDAA
jgi:hypothetical protein